MRLIKASNLFYVKLLKTQKSFVGILNTNLDKVKNIETGEIYSCSETKINPIKSIFPYGTNIRGNYDLDSYRFKHLVLPCIKRRIKKIEKYKKNESKIQLNIQKEMEF